VITLRYELGFYIPEGILNSHCREDLKSYLALTVWALQRRRNMSPVRYEQGSYNKEDAILHSHRRDDLKFYIVLSSLAM
jgi:hypothetical protein